MIIYIYVQKFDLMGIQYEYQGKYRDVIWNGHSIDGAGWFPSMVPMMRLGDCHLQTILSW